MPSTPGWDLARDLTVAQLLEWFPMVSSEKSLTSNRLWLMALTSEEEEFLQEVCTMYVHGYRQLPNQYWYH